MKISDSGDSIQNTGKRANGRGHNTSIDVAKLAGVSQATVSRAFNPASKMNPSTRQRVLDAASALKYAPDAIARSLISNSTNIVAVIMQNTTNPFYATVLSKLSIRLRSMGKQILFFYLDDEGHMKDLIHQILQYRVDGILITSVTLTSDLADTCVDFGVPVVLFNRYMNTPGIQAVCCDNVQAGRDCADYFFMKGYRSFAFIGGHDEAPCAVPFPAAPTPTQAAPRPFSDIASGLVGHARKYPAWRRCPSSAPSGAGRHLPQGPVLCQRPGLRRSPGLRPLRIRAEGAGGRGSHRL